MVSRGCGAGGNGELLFNEYGVTVLQDHKSSGHGLHNSVKLGILLNCMLKHD